jgi:hypothetical protein
VKRTLMTSTIVLLSACGGTAPEEASCANEESARNMVPTTSAPDWETVVTYGDPNMTAKTVTEDVDQEEPIFRERIQAWDCLDMAWWNPSSPKKVVQIWVDETDCNLFERSYVEFYDCDSHLGDDDTYRDLDGDGYYVTEGDCNESDALTYPDSSEICDDVDNNCDGRVDEELDCEDLEALE